MIYNSITFAVRWFIYICKGFFSLNLRLSRHVTCNFSIQIITFLILLKCDVLCWRNGVTTSICERITQPFRDNKTTTTTKDTHIHTHTHPPTHTHPYTHSHAHTPLDTQQQQKTHTHTKMKHAHRQANMQRDRKERRMSLRPSFLHSSLIKLSFVVRSNPHIEDWNATLQKTLSKKS